ncbi:MAG TPA: dockerin type I repeat-containing protein [Tepidisphaeraceae bacterium]|nr:dockerin type I repeat-containing protein [Tepidisphaeraceae bacterium]
MKTMIKIFGFVGPVCILTLASAVRASGPYYTYIQTFSADPGAGWVGGGNVNPSNAGTGDYADDYPGGYPTSGGQPILTQDFGYSPHTNVAGGSMGEMGGIIGRDVADAHYGAVVGTLGDDDGQGGQIGSLNATDTLGFSTSFYAGNHYSSPDSVGTGTNGYGIYFGYYNSSEPAVNQSYLPDFMGFRMDNGNNPQGVGSMQLYVSAANLTVSRDEAKLAYLPFNTTYTLTFSYNPDAGTYGTMVGTVSTSSGTLEDANGNVVTSITVNVPLSYYERVDWAEPNFDQMGLHDVQAYGKNFLTYFDDISYVTNIAPLLGDTNGDRKVDGADLATLLDYDGQNVAGGFNMADFNGDGVVNGDDVALFQFGLAQYQQSLAQAPEPSAIGMALAASTALLMRRRSRQ